MWLVNMNCLGVLGKKLAGVKGLTKSDVNVNWNIFFRPISNIEYQNKLRDVVKVRTYIRQLNSNSLLPF